MDFEKILLVYLNIIQHFRLYFNVHSLQYSYYTLKLNIVVFVN